MARQSPVWLLIPLGLAFAAIVVMWTPAAEGWSASAAWPRMVVAMALTWGSWVAISEWQGGAA